MVFRRCHGVCAWGEGERRHTAGTEVVMSLVALDVALQMVAALKPLLDQIRTHDRSLAEQLSRAASSVVLNVGEGARSCGRNEAVRFHSAAASASETRVGLALAEAWQYLRPEQRQPLDALLDRTLALLWGLTRRRHRSGTR
jgi:four helix bundle protein